MNRKFIALLLFTAVASSTNVEAKTRPYLNQLDDYSRIKEECNLCEEALLFKGAKEKACNRQEDNLKKIALNGKLGEENFILWWLTFPITMMMSLILHEDFMDRDIKWENRKEEHKNDIEIIVGNKSENEYQQLRSLAAKLRNDYIKEANAKRNR